MNAVRLSRISFRYEESRERTLNGADFELNYGEIALLSGASGSGKSTLMSIICGIIPHITTGEIYGKAYIDGEDAGGMTMAQINKKVGVVLQNADHQLTMRTVEEEITAAMLAGRWAKESRSGWSGDLGRFAPTEAEKARLESLLVSLRLAPLRGRHPQSLSGGEKQRVVIACALAKDPRILILDEPTSGLDGANLASIASILREEADKGRAVFLITHDLELLDACDRALDMTDFQSLLKDKAS